MKMDRHILMHICFCTPSAEYSAPWINAFLSALPSSTGYCLLTTANTCFVIGVSDAGQLNP